MAYYALHAYDADVWLGPFIGLGASHDDTSDLNSDPRYATEECNLETPGGVLQPQAETEWIADENDVPIMLASPIGTLMHLYRRWGTLDEAQDVLVAASSGRLYYRYVGSTEEWMLLPCAAPFESDVWSWVNYEINPTGSEYPVDVLLMSNAKDGMIMVVPPYGNVSNWQVTAIETPHKYGVIERYNERIWGGAIDGDPDMLEYSVPYDPTDWTENLEIPEQGAGSVQQPSWDGDAFTALRQFGSQLVAFKRMRVWRVMGTYPGEFTFKEQYGGGGPYAGTIAVYSDRILMAGNDGLLVFDGASVNRFVEDVTRRVWRRVNKAELDKMTGTIFQDRYYLAIPVDGSPINNALLVYNMNDRSLLFYTDLYFESLLATETTLYATSSKAPGKVMIIPYDSWETGKCRILETRWVSPWMDFGYKRILKGGFDVYLTPEVRGLPVTFKVSLQTEKKTKTKYCTVADTTPKARQKRIHFGGNGRRFRLVIETLPGHDSLWRLLGGVMLVAETDPD